MVSSSGKQIFALLFFSLFFCIAGYAQELPSFGEKQSSNKFSMIVAVQPGLEIRSSNPSLGADIGLGYALFNNTQVFVAAGFSRFFSKYTTINRFATANTIEDQSSGLRNLSSFKGGLRITPWKLYFSGEAGIAFGQTGPVTSNVSMFSPIGYSNVTSTLPSFRKSSFLYAPSAGFRLANGAEFGVRYEGTNSQNIPDQFALRVGFQLR